MSAYGISFDSPAWLLLLLLIPVLWWWGRRSLAALGRFRRFSVMLIRSVMVLLLVLAMAEMQLIRRTDRVAVVYLLDQSLSIPQQKRLAMIDFVNKAILTQRKPQDLAGAIVFGREPAIEVPPYDDNVQVPTKTESSIDPNYTNMAAAIKLAQAAFPHDAAKRIVIVSDGNQNIGDALEEAQGAAEAGIGIDVLPVRYGVRSEIIVEKVAIPPDVRKGQPFDLRIVVNNTNEARPGDPGVVGGTLRVSQRTSDQPNELSSQHVDLPPGKSVFTVRQQIDDPDFYTYEALFVPDDPAADAMSQNNRATTFTHVRGSGQVLLIENYENRGEHQQLVDRLRANDLEVTVRPSNQLFTGLPELQPFDTVILANVPRSGGDDVARITNFSDDQIKMLVRNTEAMGAGLVLLGGPNSFGAGGWTNTELEKAMPVDFQIKSNQVVPKGALALIMHASELADGNYWQKVIAKEAVKALGTEDYCGLLHWNGTDQWLWGGVIAIRDRRERMLGMIDRMTPGDMPAFDPGLLLAERAFVKLTDAAVKHMIVISDGDASPPTLPVINSLKRLKVTVTTVAVGCHGPAESKVMEQLALATGGKYYAVQSPQALPKIFQREARRVAQPLVYEKPDGFSAALRYPHEITSGLTGPLPPLTGFVRTTIKRNPLVELAMTASVPIDEANATILATWTYGSGRAVAFTTDDGARWAKQWATWPEYDKFFSQLVRWSMRPVADTGKFTVATEVEGNKVKVFVTALDKDDAFLNFLDLSGGVIGPDVEPRELKLQQTAPGRYVGEFDAADAGSYFMMLNPGAGMAPLRTGVNVPYSAEFSDREADVALLQSLAELTPKNGKPGVVMEGSLDAGGVESLLEIDSFRRDLQPANPSQDVWHILVLSAACLFFFDVFIRRVTISLAWAVPLAVQLRDRILRREAQPQASEYMDRLRSKKAEVSEKLEQQRSAARFEPAAPPPSDASVLEPTALGEPLAAKPRPAAPPPPPPSEQESYTSRLLKAKKKVWEERDKNKE
ncbi:MAG: VWA domain-containing protein [Planctomycetia bacterium]|nr:VWA domain-containing protein [Planctomycetia bacterium]